jgi:hypothetical protein
MSAERRRKVAMNEEFAKRLNEALRRRLYPNSTVRIHQIARACGVSEDTATRWQYGLTKMPASALGPLGRLFGPAFIAEVIPEATPMTPRDRRALAIGHAALAASEAA